MIYSKWQDVIQLEKDLKRVDLLGSVNEIHVIDPVEVVKLNCKRQEIEYQMTLMKLRQLNMNSDN